MLAVLVYLLQMEEQVRCAQINDAFTGSYLTYYDTSLIPFSCSFFFLTSSTTALTRRSI